jgi:hypothetical protein
MAGLESAAKPDMAMIAQRKQQLRGFIDEETAKELCFRDTETPNLTADNTDHADLRGPKKIQKTILNL